MDVPARRGPLDDGVRHGARRAAGRSGADPVVFPIATKIGVNPIHFDIVQTAAVGIGLFLPPMGVGLLMALRFAEVPVSQHAPYYWPYVLALLIGLVLIICLPELSLTLPRSAGFVR